MSDEVPDLTVSDAAAWTRWLEANSDTTAAIWLVLAKNGATDPTSLTYREALEEAICFGWVDGQLAKRDERTFRRRFSPRRHDSAWSKRNVELAEQLIESGRMQPAGRATIDRAKANGSWDRAYEGQAGIEVPEDLAAALVTNIAAAAMFARLDSANRYAVLYRVATAKRPETRRRQVERLTAMLARGETLHPARNASSDRGDDGRQLDSR